MASPIHEETVIVGVQDASHAAVYDVSASGQKLGFRSQSGRLLSETLSLLAGAEESDHLRFRTFMA